MAERHRSSRRLLTKTAYSRKRQNATERSTMPTPSTSMNAESNPQKTTAPPLSKVWARTHLTTSKCIAAAVCLFLLMPLVRLAFLGQPLAHYLPNVLLCFPLPSLTAWIERGLVKIDTSIVLPHAPIPEIAAEDYSYERLRRATNNWRSPAVVRGL